jgi:hypothetical protein
VVTDRQVRILMELLGKGKSLITAASKADMDEKTARKYRRIGKIPSDIKVEHTWRTREDPFSEVWEEVKEKLEINPGLEAKTLFEDLQYRYPGQFADGQLRTLQRRIKIWRALEGPPKEVFFPQKHHPGELCQSDFTHMGSLGVTIQGQPFDHLIYHFVLTYSNWETGTICFSESFESLSEGLQNAIWELGGVPKMHRTDRLSAAVKKPGNPEEFTQRYKALLNHYNLEGHKTQPESPNENGDIEQRHYRFKKALDQSLMMRGNRDFSSREEYAGFLRKLYNQLNAGRRDRFKDEQGVLMRLPLKRLESCKKIKVRVGPSSTIRVNHNVYSVHSRLIREMIEVRLYMEHLEIWYAQQRIETIPRLRGEGKHNIQYRHIIDWLVRKPGAFENYRYRDALFPTHRFRMAYDWLKERKPSKASKEYLNILYLAARRNEAKVDYALGNLIENGDPVSIESVMSIIDSLDQIPSPAEVTIEKVDLGAYDVLLCLRGEVEPCYLMS